MKLSQTKIMKEIVICDKWTYRHIAQYLPRKIEYPYTHVFIENDRDFLEFAINKPKEFLAKYGRPLSWDLDFLETDPNEVAQCNDSGAREIQRYAKKILEALAEYDLVTVTD